MTDTHTLSAEVSITVGFRGLTKTFTATSETSGEPGNVARALLFAVRDDASKWTYEVEQADRKAGTR